MAIADYRFSSPRRKEDLKQTATQRLLDQGLRPTSFRGSESESTGDVVGKWNAAVAAEAQAIKESRDPKLQRQQQLAQREASMSKANEALRKSGLAPEDLWTDEPGMARTTFTERTGRKIEMPEGAEVAAQSREVMTPEGGMVRQIAGAAGYGSTKFSPEQVAKMEAQRAKDEEQFFAVQAMRERGAKLRAEREKAAGAESIAKRESWEEDKRALAEGKDIQRDAALRLTRINRTLRGEAAFDRRGRRAEGYGQALSAEEFANLLDQKALLENVIGRRETLKEKGVTNIGRQAEISRRERLAEAEKIRMANEARALASGYGISGVKASGEVVDPYLAAINNASRSMFTNIAGAFGIR